MHLFFIDLNSCQHKVLHVTKQLRRAVIFHVFIQIRNHFLEEKKKQCWLMCPWYIDHSLYRIGILSIPEVQFLPQLVLYVVSIKRSLFLWEFTQTCNHDRRRELLRQLSYKPRSIKRFESHLWLVKFQVFAMTFAKEEEINAGILTDMMDLIRWSKAWVSILGYYGIQTRRKCLE